MSIPCWLYETSFVQSVGRKAGNKSQVPCAKKNICAAKNFTKNTRTIPSKDYLNHQSNPKSLRRLFCHNTFLSYPFLLILPCHTSRLGSGKSQSDVVNLAA